MARSGWNSMEEGWDTQEMQKLSQNDLGKTLDAMEATMALEEKPNQAFLDLHALVYVHTDPYPYDFLGSNFLNEQNTGHLTREFQKAIILTQLLLGLAIQDL
ncbi:hypothetical protein CB1_001435021 [Camelus ferus]|nr:hypothetical protein CB1_001435021 [Camelus ferus]